MESIYAAPGRYHSQRGRGAIRQRFDQGCAIAFFKPNDTQLPGLRDGLGISMDTLGTREHGRNALPHFIFIERQRADLNVANPASSCTKFILVAGARSVGWPGRLIEIKIDRFSIMLNDRIKRPKGRCLKQQDNRFD